MLPRQHVCTIQQVKNILVDWENGKFWASQAARLRMLPRQHAQENHIISGPACSCLHQAQMAQPSCYCGFFVVTLQFLYTSFLLPCVVPDLEVKLLEKCKTCPENQDAKGPSVGWPKNYSGLFRDLAQITIYFLGIIFFCFSRQKVEIFSIFLKKSFIKPHKILNQPDNHGNKNCLNQLNSLKFCEVSRNSFSQRC